MGFMDMYSADNLLSSVFPLLAGRGGNRATFGPAPVLLGLGLVGGAGLLFTSVGSSIQVTQDVIDRSKGVFIQYVIMSIDSYSMHMNIR